MDLLIIILIILIVALIIYIYYGSRRLLIYKIYRFYHELNELKKNYIAYSDYYRLKKNYSKVKTTFYFGKIINNYSKDYKNLHKLIDNLNENYVKRELKKNKEYFDKMFDYPIDEDQRIAIVTNDDNNLIVAGAGSGKTTTIIGKTKYLIEKKKVKPEEIITISFTNAATDNFIKKLGNNRVSCSTFHKLGKNILDEGNIKSDIAPEDFLDNIIKDYFTNEIFKHKDQLKDFIAFYAYYFYENSSDNDIYDFETLKNKYYKNNNLKTLKSETVKSKQELAIANFMFLNGVEYEYEPKYKYDVSTQNYRQYHPDFYLPEYDIYIEHFGINKNNKTPQYNKNNEKNYIDQMNAKLEIHKKYNTTLLQTFSYDFDEDIETVLRNKFRIYGIKTKKIKEIELRKTLQNMNFEEKNALHSLIKKFIKLFKGNNYDIEKFNEFIDEAEENNKRRNYLLLKLFKTIYIYYQNSLKEESYIDFDDMINLATKKVKKKYEKKVSYIIIDEFQDTSFSRYSLLKAIQDQTHAKVIAVGDDWQSIYRFSGCDLDLFVNFDQYFRKPKIMYISNTYRNSQNLIKISSDFIMKNEKGQISKSIISKTKNIKNPIEIFFYLYNSKNTINEAVSKLIESGCKSIGILGRNNSDIKKCSNLSTFSGKEAILRDSGGVKIIFTTIHKSKGLEYDGVIICNMDNYIAGFPNKMSDDPILNYVSLSGDDYLYEEERRLLYVALTRTKTRCFIVAPLLNQSVFLDELEEMLGVKSFDTSKIGIVHYPKCPFCHDELIIVKFGSENIAKCNNPRCSFSSKNKYEKSKQIINVFDDGNEENIKSKLYVDVLFSNSIKVYSYLCPENFIYKEGDKIQIKTYDGSIEMVTIIKGPYYDIKTNNINYKFLDLWDNKK